MPANYPVGDDLKRFVLPTGLLYASVNPTFLSAPVSAGANVSIPVTSSANFAVGDVAALDLAPNSEIVLVTGIPDGTHVQVASLSAAHGTAAILVKTTLGAPPLVTMDWQAKVDQARANFESQIGRKLLAVSQTRAFDVPTNARGILDLQDDLVSVSSCTVFGQPLIQDTDFFLRSYNSDSQGGPFTRIEFVQRFNPPIAPQQRKGIVITGPWGYATSVPQNAFNAILAGAALLCVPELALARSKGLQSRTEGDVQETYARGQGNGPLQEEGRLWAQQFADGVSAFFRVEQGA